MRRYPGLSPFTKEQKDVFFGRKNDIRQLSKLIFVESKVLLYSKSGYGKTSLLNAGVIPELSKNQDFEFIHIRFRAYTKDGNTPDDTFLQTVKLHPDFKTTKNDTLIDLYAQDFADEYWSVFKKNQLAGNHNKTYLLVFDQFEELFTYPDEQISRFKNKLADLLAGKMPEFIRNFERTLFKNKKAIGKADFEQFYNALNIKAVFSMRSDRLSELNALADKITDIQKVFYELQPLNEEQAQQAIINPAKQEGDFDSPPFTYEEPALKKIINALAGKGKIETTQLQIVCQRLEENIIEKNPVKLVVSEKDIPNLKDIFLEFYNQAINTLSEEHQESAQELIELGFIRNGQRLSIDINICLDFIPEQELQKLVNAHLLRIENNSVGGLSYELIHDTLVNPISELTKIREEKNKQKIEIEKQNKILQNIINQLALKFYKKKKSIKYNIVLHIATLLLLIVGFYIGDNIYAELGYTIVTFSTIPFIYSIIAIIVASMNSIRYFEKIGKNAVQIKGIKHEEIQSKRAFVFFFKNIFPYIAITIFIIFSIITNVFLWLKNDSLINKANQTVFFEAAQKEVNEFKYARNDEIGYYAKELDSLTLLHRFLPATNNNKYPDEMLLCTNLTYLNISNNGLTKFPDDVFKFKNLESLIMGNGYIIGEDNHISSIPPTISELKKLKTLSLYDVGLTDLPVELSYLVNLSFLQLSSNKLDSLPIEFRNLINLTFLGLSDNNDFSTRNFETIFNNYPKKIVISNGYKKPSKDSSILIVNIAHTVYSISNFTNISTLSELELQGADIKILPPQIGSLPSLNKLDLSRNELNDLPPEIGNLTKLTELYLADNELTALPPEIGKLTNLTRLSLSDNALTALPPEIKSLNKLRSLDLRNNNFSAAEKQKIESWFEGTGCSIFW